MGKSTIKDITDYTDYILEKYPFLKRSTVNRILVYGLRVYMGYIERYANVLIDDGKGRKCRVGESNNTDSGLKKNIARTWRFKWYKYGREWDGYYYCPISNSLFKEIDKDKLEKHLFIEFKYLKMYKIPEECFYKHRSCTHFFKIKYPLDCGFYMYKDKFRTKNYEYLGAWRNEGTALTTSRKDETPISTQSQLQITS